MDRRQACSLMIAGVGYARTATLSNSAVEQVYRLGLSLLATGLRAGSGYPEVWIRDTNTFIEAGLKVMDRRVLRQALLNFFTLQGPTGDIVDGFSPKGSSSEPAYRTSPTLPQYSAHKNTVESDQESSLVSAVRKYVEGTGDRAFLDESVQGISVRKRLAKALDYLYAERWDHSRGLVWGGTTVDWGDVQPETYPGTHLNEKSHRSCGIYANAMLTIAIDDYLKLVGDDAVWLRRKQELHRNIRTHLWQPDQARFIPHLYLDGSPFGPEVDESRMYYHGGTAIAVEAGILTREEVSAVLSRMRENVRAANAGSIGLTVYPPYPNGVFRDPILTQPYTYQNGGDWDWFGGRMVQQLIRYGMLKDACVELQPMLSRVIAAGGFFEWWSRGNQPRGSGKFRGAAGVLAKAISDLRSASRSA